MIIASRNLLLFTAIYSFSFFSMHAAEFDVKEQLFNARTVAEAKRILEQHPNFDITNIKNHLGETLLIYCVRWGEPALIAFYKNRGLSPLDESNYQWNSLHVAASTSVINRIYKARCLLDDLTPAQIIELCTGRNNHRETPLDMAKDILKRPLYHFLERQLEQARANVLQAPLERAKLLIDADEHRALEAERQYQGEVTNSYLFPERGIKG